MRRSVPQVVPSDERAGDTDPLTSINHSWPGWLDFLEGKGTAALLPPVRRAFDMVPDSPYAQWFQAWALACNQRTAEARALLDQLSRAFPETGFGRLAPFFKAALGHDRVAALLTPVSQSRRL